MLESLLPWMRCSLCTGTRLVLRENGLGCRACGFLFPFRDGILDMLGDASAEVITPFQRIMQSPPVVAVYERLWRPAGYFLAASRPFGAEVETVLRMLRAVDADRVLDLACGPGIFTRPLARGRATLVVGLDLSLPMLRRARLAALRHGIENIVWVRGTAFRLPFVSGAFSAINCCGGLHLFDRPDRALEEMERVVARGGYLSVQTTIRPDRSAGLAYLLERFIRFGFFEESELRERIRLHHFKILQSERHRISYTFLARHFS